MKDVDPQWLSDTIFIIDFGIAFLQEQSSVDIGTPKSYCAPELFFHSPRSISSDIWALGCTIFEIRTGSQLFSFKGRPSRTQRLMAMVKMLGKMPDEWFADWDEGAEWYTAQVEKGGELADIIKGTLYTEIMDVGVHDADYRQIFTPYIDEQAGRSSEDVSRTSTLSRMIAIVGDLTTSEVDYVLEEANKSDEKPGGSGSGNSGDSNKATSGSSNSKSGEKSTSSEGISTGTKPDTAKESTGDRADILSLRGEDSLSRMPLASVKELPEPSAVRDFLEQSGMKVTAIEGEGLDELLRMALTFLPGDRIGPKELSKHHWFVDNFED
jgi:serine/threonine-protein kinase SRPK3